MAKVVSMRRRFLVQYTLAYRRLRRRVIKRKRDALVDQVMRGLRRGEVPEEEANQGLFIARTMGLTPAEEREISAKAWAHAKKAMLRPLTWYIMRQEIYERDQRRCWFCGKHALPEHYDLGHLHDRVCGGDDSPENLVVMHNACNQLYKPLHWSIDEAKAWGGKPDWHFAHSDV